ncbi:MAG: hypothetical protein RBR69_01220 [Candidatus Cloacimonadaceae bacterium]|jgi:hypothetical protein|nr:hypothetical protein [Candidatus Cloacimonadota bacterium]MCK9178338.1 hypothetical protein [Candidatus Cloacimonadota bacterium]MDY0126745.1 hypothetical protein [Candidatus Cloacimonadaceae bacterium]
MMIATAVMSKNGKQIAAKICKGKLLSENSFIKVILSKAELIGIICELKKQQGRLFDQRISL